MFSAKITIRLVAVFSTIGLTVPGALAHVTMSPRESAAGANQEYTMRVPTEKNTPTVRIEVQFPGAAEISSFEQKPGGRSNPRKTRLARLPARSGAARASRRAKSRNFIFLRGIPVKKPNWYGR